MPYIKHENREMLQLVINEFSKLDVSKLTDGDMDYLITVFLADWIKAHGVRYTTFNSAVGILECAKLELCRRALGPYENKKVVENGDVPFYSEFDYD